MQPTKATFNFSVLCVVLLLSGFGACSQDPPPVVAQTPKAVRTYTIPQQQQIAKERNALPDDDIFLNVLDEWHDLRSEKKAGKCE